MIEQLRLARPVLTDALSRILGKPTLRRSIAHWEVIAVANPYTDGSIGTRVHWTSVAGEGLPDTVASAVQRRSAETAIASRTGQSTLKRADAGADRAAGASRSPAAEKTAATITPLLGLQAAEFLPNRPVISPRTARFLQLGQFHLQWKTGRRLGHCTRDDTSYGKRNGKQDEGDDTHGRISIPHFGIFVVQTTTVTSSYAGRC